MKFIVNAFNGNEKLWKVLVIGSIPLSLMSLLPETYKPNTLEIVVVSTYSILLSIPVFKCGLKYNYYIFPIHPESILDPYKILNNILLQLKKRKFVDKYHLIHL